MPARHQGGFLWFALQILPSLGQAYQSKFSKPLQIHGLVRLWYGTSSPETFAAQGAYPRLILIDSITHIKLRHRIATLELFEFHHTQLSAYPAIQFLQFVIASEITIVISPAGQGQIEPSDYLWIPARFVTPGQFTNPVLKTGDTLAGQSKAPVAETGDSQGSFFRLHGRPPISPD